jgi:hypothetical protein
LIEIGQSNLPRCELKSLRRPSLSFWDMWKQKFFEPR